MRKIFLLLISLFVLQSATAQLKEPVKWTFEMVGDELHFTAHTDLGWHIYDRGPYSGGPVATTIEFVLPEGVTLSGELQDLDKPERKMDDIFGMEIGYYGREARFVQAFHNDNTTEENIVVNISWQACDEGSCVMGDIEKKITIAGNENGSISKSEAKEEAAISDKEHENVKSESTPVKRVREDVATQSDNEENSKSLWAVIIEAILWGFAALLTPCVFPMVPMTVSFFIKGSGSKSAGRFKAMFYGFSIVALYTLPIAAIIGISYFGGGEAVTADIFNWLATHWVPNLLFFLIFMVFAASFFGAFEITMPSKLVNKTDSKADKKGLMGVFFMAMTLVLVSFSCTGPIVGTIIVKSTQGEIWEPIITMLAFSAAFALPFTLFALFPSLLKNLPKSGGWLNSVKVVLGFIEVALGLKFLSVADQTYHWGILDREVYLALWIVVFTLLGFYLLGKLKFAHDSETKHVSVPRLFMAIITFSFVVYMIPGMWGAPLKALSGYMPPVSTMDFNLTTQNYGGGVKSGGLNAELLESGAPKYSEFLHLPHGLEGFYDLEEAKSYAAKVNKPLFIDFTGHGCVNCREMEANVWSDPNVLARLREDFVIVALYVDDKKELPESDWVVDSRGRTLKTLGKINASYQIDTYGTNAQPYYIVMNPSDEKLLVEPKSYDLNVDNFVEFLDLASQNFKK